MNGKLTRGVHINEFKQLVCQPQKLIHARSISKILMVRAWLRPCASAVAVLGRRSKGSAKAALLSAQIPRYWTVCTDVSPQIGN
ncbi:uncharacterized protein PHALS_11562 [Plasmopara halstedii]|uniref:Uncharacterized protein n=1 Tax=Plasmopara halstedii TaxID=4781 RepID=A0A0P1AKU0_PLAHL|nr:uncharacterized protein PHALS_11562 [Plasmopara halstedii]CEG41199.1 hypothetical protein PHALS_11562 [Plasmopara halstedii]|eukprot:XP_024577568.1 hypothetical protein PHALS_11562 [Plasmopara halstedii]